MVRAIEPRDALDEQVFLGGRQRAFFGRSQDIPDEIAEHRIGQSAEAHGHEALFGVGEGGDLITRYDLRGTASAEELYVAWCVLDNASCERAAILGGNGEVFVAVADDLVWIDHVGEDRI